jgi:anti-anti-sigma factor
MEPFQIDVEEKPDRHATIARLKGSAGIGAADKIEQAFTRLSVKRPSLLVLDMSHVEFVASIVIGSLVRLQHDLARHNGKLRLASVQATVWDVFKRCRLDTVFQAHDTVDTALSAT